MFNLTNNIIAVDICNTIADVISVINARLGYNPNPAEYFHPALWDKPYYFEENLDIFLEAKPIASSIEILNELSIYNEIIYITARPEIAEFVTKLWLKENNYPKGKVYFSKNKAKLASKLGVDIAIEDAPFEIERYIKAGIKVFIKEQAYNIGYENRFEWKYKNSRKASNKKQG